MNRIEYAVNRTLQRWQTEDAISFCRVAAGNGDPIFRDVSYPTGLNCVQVSDNYGNKAEVSLEVFCELSRAGWKVLYEHRLEGAI